MDTRRTSRVIDPKVRHVGFFFSGPAPDGSHTQTGDPSDSPPASNRAASSNSLSPVMIPPPLHSSEVASRAVDVPASTTPGRLRRNSFDNESTNDGEVLIMESCYPSGSVMGTSPPMSGIGDELGGGGTELSNESGDCSWHGDEEKFYSSVSTEGFKESKKITGKGGGQVSKVQNDFERSSKTSKEKTTKAERRALQEAQRAAKAGGKKPPAAPGFPSSVHEHADKNTKQPQKKDGTPVTSVSASDKKSGDRSSDKERKKDAPAPRMQFDDNSRVEKAKKRAVVKQTEVRNRVELFRHLPQYERGTQRPDLEAKFFQLDPMHPSVYKVGLQFLSGDIYGGNARCTAMLAAFREAIGDYSTPPQKTLSRDLTLKINSFVSFLIECRPLSISMGNAIRFLKARIGKLPLTLSESDAKTSLCADIDRFINEKIVLADKVIVGHAVTKIRDGDVLLTYGSSSVVEMVLLHAYELGKKFRIVVVDSRPRLEGQALLHRLLRRGMSCTYIHINAVSYIMHEVTIAFLGAASIFSNGTVYSRVGTSCVAMIAHAFRVPVLVCCEAYKFQERVLLDSICCNELGDPEAISKVPGKIDGNILDNLGNKENLQLLNLMYDATPGDFVSVVVTEYGMIPTTSVPVIVREYGREHMFF